MRAIRYSFRQNGQAMQGQDQAALARQKAAFDASQALNKARNQAFDNYLLDRTAITELLKGVRW